MKRGKVMQERRVPDAVHHMCHANSCANKKQKANTCPQKDGRIFLLVKGLA